MVRLVGLEVLKRRLQNREDEVVTYREFLDACVEAGAAPTHGQAEALAGAMDQSGSIVLFRGKVYLHPEKIVDLVRSAVPPVLEIENDARREEFELLKKKKGEIDRQACKQVRRILWSGFWFVQATVGLCFRFTFWEFTWDVVAPITFFVAGAHLLSGYAYFLITSRNLSYRTYMERLFKIRRRALCTKHDFDIERYLEMERHMRCPLGGDCSQGTATKAIFGEIERRMQDGVISHGEPLGALMESGLTPTEAEALVQKMDEMSLVLLVRGKTYLNHKKIADLIRRAVPFALAPEGDARKEEFRQLQMKMQEIDDKARRHAVRILCVGFASFILQFALFFHLTFWEFSWSIMEPLAYFLAGLQLIFCYGYFLRTASNPTLQDFKRRLFLARRRKLCAKLSFDMDSVSVTTNPSPTLKVTIRSSDWKGKGMDLIHCTSANIPVASPDNLIDHGLLPKIILGQRAF
uniref:Calcium uniporter protein C-terminal domain-containing protein n=1 Tax=Aegilops tauschii TaxID=37682 RepID=M8CFH9_AEGTA